ncbi:hypothetical protein OSTOST_25439 [Ostertagia ostertagi]
MKRIEDDVKEEEEDEDLNKPGTSGLISTLAEPADIKPFDIKPNFAEGSTETCQRSELEIKEEPADECPEPPPPAPPPTPSTAEVKPTNGLLGLCAYGSGSDSD